MNSVLGDEKCATNTFVKISHGCVEAEKLSEPFLWHLRLGHTPLQKLQHLGVINKHNKPSEHFCVTCPMVKLTRQPFHPSHSHANEPFKLLHIDVWGPYKVHIREGFKFFLTIVYDHSRNTWVTLLKNKSDSFSVLMKFVTLAHTQFDRKVKIVRSDNALEFEDSHCKALYDSYGIVHQTTCVDRAQQNGRCERKHRNILEMARCLRMQAGLPKTYWGECVLTSAFLINRLPTTTLY